MIDFFCFDPIPLSPNIPEVNAPAEILFIASSFPLIPCKEHSHVENKVPQAAKFPVNHCFKKMFSLSCWLISLPPSLGAPENTA